MIEALKQAQTDIENAQNAIKNNFSQSPVRLSWGPLRAVCEKLALQLQWEEPNGATFFRQTK